MTDYERSDPPPPYSPYSAPAQPPSGRRSANSYAPPQGANPANSSRSRPLAFSERDLIVSPSSRPDDFPFPNPALAWLERDITQQDWATFLTNLLGISSIASQDWSRRQEKMEDDVDDWNEVFFEPRGVRINILFTSQPSRRRTRSLERHPYDSKSSSRDIDGLSQGMSGLGLAGGSTRFGPRSGQADSYYQDDYQEPSGNYGRQQLMPRTLRDQAHMYQDDSYGGTYGRGYGGGMGMGLGGGRPRPIGLLRETLGVGQGGGLLGGGLRGGLGVGGGYSRRDARRERREIRRENRGSRSRLV